MFRRWLTALWKKSPHVLRTQTPQGKPRRPQRQRIERYFECNWLSPWGEEETRVRSISRSGCYVDARLSVPPEGTWIRELKVALPGGCITVEGMVLQANPGVGFAVRFTSVDDQARVMLTDLVATRH